jgi:hypothetical protein
MNIRHKVIMYGDSIVLMGIQVGLEVYPNLDVLCVERDSVTLEMLRSSCPSVIIFDMHVDPPSCCYGFAQETPYLLLIGVDVECNQIVLWSARQHKEITIQDLVKLINQELHSR